MRLYHLHINRRCAEEDINCLLPNQRLAELASRGEIGAAAPRHYSIMGYIMHPETLLAETIPAIIEHLRADRVDAVLLAPA